jgi:GT2 family glycosyltransferase
MTSHQADLHDLAIIVVTYGSPALLRQHLARTSVEVPEATVVVVDNYRDDESRREVRLIAVEHAWDLVENEINVGFGSAADIGVARARELGASWFLILNPDASIDRASVEALLAAAAVPLTLASPTLLRTDGSVWFDGADLYLQDGSTGATRKRPLGVADDQVAEWLTGACLMTGWDLWARVGGFGDTFFLYWEDIDLSFRVRAAGGTLVVVPDAIAVHDVGATTQERGARAKSEVYYYYNVRNRLLFAARHFDERTTRRWIRASIPAAWAILLRGGKRQLLHSAAPWRGAIRGTWDGRRLAKRELSKKRRLSAE